MSLSPPAAATPPRTGSSSVVLLLKTKSTPSDAYQDLLTSHDLEPLFVPVLLHQFLEPGLATLRALLEQRKIGPRPDCEYGGLIFTSQRAVEAFAKVVEDGREQNDDQWPHLHDIPIYTVGPATTRALSAIPQHPPLQLFGSHTGNGDALAQYILDHYNAWPRDSSTQPSSQPPPSPPSSANKPLLFLVGEQRRDIIPKTLTSDALPAKTRIPVVEQTVYGTGVMPSFPSDLQHALRRDEEASDQVGGWTRYRWVVVFSPTGCDSMLSGLGLLDASGRAATVPAPPLERCARDGRTFVATIGPTTRRHLMDTFGFEPDVCAETPTPEGVLKGILDFESRIESESAHQINQ